MQIVTNHAAILRARRKRAAWGEDDHAIYTRHRWQVEGAHGTAKTLHGLARAIRKGLENMKIQARMTAIGMNLKKLAAAVMLLVCSIMDMRAARPNPASAASNPKGKPHDRCERLVRAYLAAMEARDLPAARAMLAPGFAMVFPGDVRMTSLAQVLEWTAPAIAE